MKRRILGLEPFRFVFMILFLIMGIVLACMGKFLSIAMFLMVFMVWSKQALVDKGEKIFKDDFKK
jgi:hypothetical protein